MSATLVIQSHRSPLPFNWIKPCLESVKSWARSSHYDYRFIGDELFDPVDQSLLAKIKDQIVVSSDLARLKCLQQGLLDGYHCVIWCDADFLIFNPGTFVLPDVDFALGREVWVQHDKQEKLRSYAKVHNAFLMFRGGNHFLDFYAATAERLLHLNRGSIAPQFIGPKLLTALHNIAQCPVMETAGMFSPLVLRDLLAGGGDALEMFRGKSPLIPAGANLSSSLTEREGFTDSEMESLVQQLLTSGV